MRTLLAIALMLAPACAQSAPTIPTDPPAIAGSITAIDRGGERIGTIRVEVRPSDASGSPKAVVSIEQKTAVLTAAAERRDFNSLRIGQSVRVWFDGPVRESYPVQASGRTVVIDVP